MKSHFLENALVYQTKKNWMPTDIKAKIRLAAPRQGPPQQCLIGHEWPAAVLLLQDWNMPALVMAKNQTWSDLA